MNMMWDRQPGVSCSHGSGAVSMAGWDWPSDSSLNYINHGLMLNPLANPATNTAVASPAASLVTSLPPHESPYWSPAPQASINDSAAVFNPSLVFHNNSSSSTTTVTETGLVAGEMSLYSGHMAVPADARRPSSTTMMNGLVKREMSFPGYDLSGALNLGGMGRINDYMLMSSGLLRFGRRPRPSSPAQLLAPRCQAEGCKANLSLAKHYHRRHKVCEIHSKSATVRLNGTTQRFCQQCSRFHALDEFDEGKRSCRKRLADHNKRRRKPQPSSNSSTSSATVTASTDTTSKTATTSQKFREQDGANLSNNANGNIKGDNMISEAPDSPSAEAANIKGDNMTSEAPASPSADSSMRSPEEASVKRDNRGPNLSLSMLSNSIPWQMPHHHHNHHRHGLLMQDHDIEEEREEEKEEVSGDYHHHHHNYPFSASETNNSLHQSDPSKVIGLHSDWRSPFNKLIYNASDHCL